MIDCGYSLVLTINVLNKSRYMCKKNQKFSTQIFLFFQLKKCLYIELASSSNENSLAIDVTPQKEDISASFEDKM